MQEKEIDSDMKCIFNEDILAKCNKLIVLWRLSAQFP
jgi:hypothetical protein